MTPNRTWAAVAALGTTARDSVSGTADPTRRQLETRPLQVCIRSALIAQLLLVGALLGTVALSGNGPGLAGWVVGISCGVATNLGLSRAVSHFRVDRLTPADWVTLARATLASVVAALVAGSFLQPVPRTMLVAVAAVALVLDAVDGWVARRTATGSLGANLDGEVDAFLILVLSVYVARSAGAWVLLIGAARYVFLAAGWVLPWMRAPLPPRYWRKFVAATQGIVLTVATANVVSLDVIRAALVVSLVMLAESFGRDVWWLRIRRLVTRSGPPMDPDPNPVVPSPNTGRRRVRTVLGIALTVLAFLYVWVALVGPEQPIHLKFSAFLRLPLEGFVFVALAAVVAPRVRRWLVWVAGPVLGLVLILKLFDLSFFAGFDRPFDPYQDLRYAGFASQTVRESVGQTTGTLVIIALAVVLIAVLVLMALAVRRLSRIAAEHRVGTLRGVGAVGAVWILCWAVGAQFVSQTPIASTSAAALIVGEVNTTEADINDHATFAREISHDRFAATPANQLLTGLRGKDVLLLFVESYGQVAVQGTSFSPAVDAVLASGNKRLKAAGFSARSGFLTSPTFGGISWLAHSTMQSGLLVNTPQRYTQLLNSDRFTLTEAFDRAGWRTVDDVPSDDEFWAPGKTFYHFDKLYDRYDVGYKGPPFAFASMPDQYVMAALQRLELAPRHRRPVFAEVDLVSSHEPWTRIPQLLSWNQVGDGSIFKHARKDAGDGSLHLTNASEFLQINGSPVVQAAYGESIQYTMNTLISYVQHYGNPNLVMIVLGDHQPWTVVSGAEPNHDVPISIIAHDPAVLKRISGWGWSDGLKPSPKAPVWPMSAFRDRFLTAFGPQPATTKSP
jgi:phosphatidylglycerophosphate synthase